MTSPNQLESKDDHYQNVYSLWGEINDKPNSQQQRTRVRERGDEMMEEDAPREDAMEEENDDDSSEDDEDSGVPKTEEKNIPQTSKELPIEFEKVIRTAYKPEGTKVVFPLRIPDVNDNKEDEEVPYEYCRTNDVVHHTIRLNQHFRIMSALLHIAQNTKGTEFRKFPPIPDMVIRKRKTKRFKKLNFSIPIYQHQKPYLEKKTLQKMLQKSVVIILAQLGVDKATKSVVLVLVDVVKEFLRKLCLTCSTYSQWDLTKGHMNFRSVMHRSLVDMGLRRGHEDIKEYCENMVKRRNKAFRRTFHLVRLYLKTVYAARMKARFLGGTVPTTNKPRTYNARTMLPHQGLSVYLPRGMQTITVMERTRPYIRKYQEFRTNAPAPMLASKFAENYVLTKNELPPELSAILRPTDTVDQ